MLLCLFVALLVTVSNAQELDRKIDSLNKEYQVEVKDSVYFEELLIILDLYNSDVPHLTIPHYKNVLTNIKGMGCDRLKELACNDLGAAFYYSADYDSAKKYFEVSYKLAEKIDVRLAVERLSNLSVVYSNLGEKEKELKAYLDVVRTVEANNDSSMMVSAFTNLGSYYYYEGPMETAIDYFNRAIRVGESGFDEKYLPNAYMNLGYSYQATGQGKLAKQNFENALAAAIKYNDTYYEASSYSSIAEFYEKTDFDKAESNYNLALKLSSDHGYEDIEAMASFNLGELYLGIDLKAALAHMERALELYEESGYKEQIVASLDQLAECESLMKNDRNAYDYLRRKEAYQQNMLDEMKEGALADMKTKYETDKIRQQAEIDRLESNLLIKEEQEKTETQQFYTIMSLVGVCVLILVAMLLIRGNRIKQRANVELHKANVQIEAQRDEIKLQKEEIEQINKDLTDSINYAKQLQDSILPSDERLSLGLGEVFVFFRPRDVVSGDFYWYHEEGDKVFLAAADCTGHGVPGAFVSMVCQSVLNKVVVEDGIQDPGNILSKAHQGVVSTFKKENTKRQSNDGMDIAITVWDRSVGKLFYAGAMNPLVVVREKEVIEVKADRRGIGGIANRDYDFTTHELILNNGDMIYLFSDGFQDQFGGIKGKKFMVKKLKALFVEISQLPVKEQQITLNDTFNKWSAGYEQVDDVLITGYRVV